MANNIDSSAAFATAVMKPVSGEVLDAIWGRKVADNTGYLFYNMPLKAGQLGGVGFTGSMGGLTWGQSGTTRFQKMPGYVSLWGTCSGSMSNFSGRGT